MHQKNKTNWDYFCQLMTAVPGLTAVFSDSYLSGPEGGADGERRERAVAMYRQVQDAQGEYFTSRD